MRGSSLDLPPTHLMNGLIGAESAETARITPEGFSRAASVMIFSPLRLVFRWRMI
jgi:hypothetical protein